MSRVFSRHVPVRWLLALLAGGLGLSNLLLWRFLDIAPWWAFGLGGVGVAAICYAILHIPPPADAPKAYGPRLDTLALCFLVAVLLLLLGGEGRFFYANIDWQVRNAVFRDIAINPWPFAYTARSVPDLLRAPVGMFLAPALVFKAFGQRAGDIALLLQNSAFLAILLALGSQLFATWRLRSISLIIFIFFSGLDVVGNLLAHRSIADHLESWAGIQYSSTITLAFWVPQHAVAGWTGAVLYLLWRSGRIPLSIFLTIVPLTALWSPLGLIGTVPFAGVAAWTTLRRKALQASDVLLPGIACILCAPSLLYLGAAGDDVGIRVYPVETLQYLIFQIMEIAPYLVPLIICRKNNRWGMDTLAIVAACVLLMPFVQIGWSLDFMMRSSIPALTIMTVMVADAVTDRDPVFSTVRKWLATALLIGSLTGLSEIKRAVVQQPAPVVSCTFFKAWDQSFSSYPKGSYLAPMTKVPALVRPADPKYVSSVEPTKCWPGEWYRPGA